MKTVIKFSIASATSALVLVLSGCAGIEQAPVAVAPPAGAGWIALIDGTNLNAFVPVGNAPIRLENGMAKAEVGTGYLLTKKSFQNFELSAEVYVDSVANSGVMIRCAKPPKVDADDCYEFNVWDVRPDPTYATGAIVNVAKVTDFPRAAGKWNSLNITANGSHLTYTVNGTKTADVQNSKLPAAGPLAFQFDGYVRFRNVWIRPLN